MGNKKKIIAMIVMVGLGIVLWNVRYNLEPTIHPDDVEVIAYLSKVSPTKERAFQYALQIELRSKTTKKELFHNNNGHR